MHFNTCSLGAEEYIELLRVKLEQINYSIIVLDGDKNNDTIKNKLKKIGAKNVMFYQAKDCPRENVFLHKFLFNLPAESGFWDNDLVDMTSKNALVSMLRC